MAKNNPKKPSKKNPFLAIGITFLVIGISVGILQDLAIGIGFFVPGLVFIVLGIKSSS